MAISADSHSGQRHEARKGIAAGLGEIAPGADAEPRAQRLQHDRHHVGQQRHRQQRVAELANRRRARSPSCRDPYSRPRPGNPGRGRPAACARTAPACAVCTEANIPASDGSPRAPRQPGPSGARAGTGAGGGSGSKSGFRASIFGNMGDIRSYCNSFASASEADRGLMPWAALSVTGWFGALPGHGHCRQIETCRESRHVRSPKRRACRRPSTAWPGPISPPNRPSRSRWPPLRSSRC